MCVCVCVCVCVCAGDSTVRSTAFNTSDPLHLIHLQLEILSKKKNYEKYKQAGKKTQVNRVVVLEKVLPPLDILNSLKSAIAEQR